MIDAKTDDNSKIMELVRFGAVWNTGNAFDTADLKDSIFSIDDRRIVETHEPVSSYTKTEAKAGHNGVKFYVREDFQIKKGLRRGDLFIADFGDVRLVGFTGEGVIS